MRQSLFFLASVNALPAAAQESENHPLADYPLEASGHPGPPTSTYHQFTLVNVASDAVAPGLSGLFYQIDTGMADIYPPLGEVDGLRFTDVGMLDWIIELSKGVCNLHRDQMSHLSELGHVRRSSNAHLSKTDHPNEMGK